MFMIAEGRLFDAIVMKELRRLPSVFAGDEVYLAQKPKGTHGDIFQISYGRCDEI